jgi:uncharacterized membrane protein
MDGPLTKSELKEVMAQYTWIMAAVICVPLFVFIVGSSYIILGR